MDSRLLILGCFWLTACGSDANTPNGAAPADPNTAPVVSVDRFSDRFAHLFARSKNPALPAPNAPIAFDSGPPFITHGLGPVGGTVTYYNFDVLPTVAAPIYVLFRSGEAMAVEGQLNIIDVIPGDPGYNDFWNVVKVTVPSDYVANSVTSVEQITKAKYALESTTMLVNCPVVPDGSTAHLRYTASESQMLQRGWYKNQVVKYFTFAEHTLMTGKAGSVPLADIYVSFNLNPNPNNPVSGPASGFETEAGTMQTHNVPAVLPADTAYSPLWNVVVYDDAAFSSVSDLMTAMKAPILAPSAAYVNCPIVAKQ